jgi:hypothetical protein
LLVLPVLVDLARSPRERPFGYAAADTFYYLGLARVAVEQGSLSTDGVHPTNGFHPLWQLITIVVYAVCHLLHQTDAALLVLVLVSLACVAGALWLLGEAFRRTSGSVPTAFVVLPIGVYALLASYYWHVGPPNANGGLEGPLPVYGTLYSFVNGMESGLTLLAFALLAQTLLRREAGSSLSSGLKCGGACAFLCLARLDHAAFILTPLALWGIELFQARARYRFLVAALLSAVLPIAGYCLVNLLYAGLPLPVSGVEKNLFPALSIEQIAQAMTLLRSPLSAIDPTQIFRVLPMVLCLFWALAYAAIVTKVRVGERGLWWGLRGFATRLDAFLLKMAPGVVLLSSYDLLFVLGVGHWYFPVSTLYMSLTFVSLCRAVLGRVRLSIQWPALAGVALAAAVVGLFLRFHYKPAYHREYAKFYWETAPRVRQQLSGKVPKLIEVDDGIIAYSLRVPSLTSTGYLLDAEAMRAKRAKRLFDVAYHRGFRAVSTLYYGVHGHLREGNGSTARDWVQRMMVEDLSGYVGTVVYDDPTFSIVELRKQEG